MGKLEGWSQRAHQGLKNLQILLRCINICNLNPTSKCLQTPERNHSCLYDPKSSHKGHFPGLKLQNFDPQGQITRGMLHIAVEVIYMQTNLPPPSENHFTYRCTTFQHVTQGF